MPRGDLWKKNPKAWFALRARLQKEGKWYGNQQQRNNTEPQQDPTHRDSYRRTYY